MPMPVPTFKTREEEISYWGVRPEPLPMIPQLDADYVTRLQEQCAGVPMNHPDFRDRMLAYEEKHFGKPKSKWLDHNWGMDKISCSG